MSLARTYVKTAWRWIAHRPWQHADAPPQARWQRLVLIALAIPGLLLPPLLIDGDGSWLMILSSVLAIGVISQKTIPAPRAAMLMSFESAVIATIVVTRSVDDALWVGWLVAAMLMLDDASWSGRLLNSIVHWASLAITIGAVQWLDGQVAAPLVQVLAMLVLVAAASLLLTLGSKALYDPRTRLREVIPVAALTASLGVPMVVFASTLVSTYGYLAIWSIIPVVWAVRRVARSHVEIEQVRMVAMQDVLTGVRNRRALEEDAQRYMQQALSQSGAVSVLLLDVDHFKQVNDTYGHDAGDQVLRRVAASLDACAARSRLAVDVYRAGGEEFVLLVREEHSMTDLLLLADYVLEAVRTTPVSPRVTASMGVATHAVAPNVDYGITLEAEAQLAWSMLMREADQRLYIAKDAGRDRMCTEADAA